MAIVKTIFRRFFIQKGLTIVLPALVWMLTTAMAPLFQPTVSKEYQVKAIFLFNFSQFVEWPASSFSDAKSPLVIGIWGDNPFGSYLKETINDETVKGRPLIIQYCRNTEDIKSCHILFFNERTGNKAEQILTGIKGKNILTVSDADNFIQQGGMVRFFTENNKIRMQINTKATGASNLTISSNLLRLAQIINTK
jgi:hypothetical protein